MFHINWYFFKCIQIVKGRKKKTILHSSDDNFTKHWVKQAGFYAELLNLKKITKLQFSIPRFLGTKELMLLYYAHNYHLSIIIPITQLEQMKAKIPKLVK